MTNRTLIFRYSLFAIIAMILNIYTQRIILGLYEANYFFFFLAIILGTLTGLIVKYFLDKNWIFYDLNQNFKENYKKFLLYTAMGIGSTLIFWGFETIFWLIWKTNLMRELGAIIGLTIGYIFKFMLDRKYVFINNRLDNLS